MRHTARCGREGLREGANVTLLRGVLMKELAGGRIV